MEHIVASNIMQYAEDNIIAPEQHGFTRGCSSETQLHGLIDELTLHLQAGKQADLAVLAFSKAFDKVAPCSTSCPIAGSLVEQTHGSRAS